MNCFHLGWRAFHSRSLPPTQQGCAALHKNLRGGAPNKENQPTSEITPPHASAFHSHPRPRPAHSSTAKRAHPHLSSLHVLTRAQRSRVHFHPQHWLLCHLGLLKLHTSGPRDVPRCGALSLLQTTPHYRGVPAETAARLNVKLCVLTDWW